MPLFGPNIKKMKEKGDIEGLVKTLNHPKMCVEAIKALIELKHIESLIGALNSDNPRVRIEVTEALKNVNKPDVLNALNKTLTNALRFGEMEEQVEAITLIQGRAPKHFLSFALPGEPERVQALEKVSKKLNLKTFRNALLEVVKRRKSAASVWYTLVALIELGDRSTVILHDLIEFSDAWIKKLATGESLFACMVSKIVHEETLRALSRFKGNSTVTDVIVKIYEGKFLSSPDIAEEDSKVNAIYALGALGDPSMQERLEYFSHHDNESIRKAARAALELYGKAPYDEIKDRAEAK